MEYGDRGIIGKLLSEVIQYPAYEVLCIHGMKIDATLGTQTIPSNPNTATPVGEPIVSFGDVMTEAGQDAGSTKKAEEFTALRDAFSEWQSGLDTTHPLNLPRYEAVASQADSFLNIVEKAVKEDGYSDPIGFLKGLSGSEMETLRIMHSLAAPIEPGDISEEGALNLLLPMNERKDIDNDGFVDVGKSVSWSFPPPNAPQSVHDAWEKTIEGISMGDKLMASAMFLPSMLRIDDSGNVSEIERSEANNPYAKKGFSFSAFAQKRLDSLEYFKNQMDGGQYEVQKGALSKFLEELGTV